MSFVWCFLMSQMMVMLKKTWKEIEQLSQHNISEGDKLINFRLYNVKEQI